MTRVLFTLILIVAGVCAKHEIYDGYAIYQVTVENEAQMEILKQLEIEYNLDVWSHATLSRPGMILIDKHLKDDIKEKLFFAGIPYVIETDNVKELLDLEDRLLAKSSRTQKNGSFVGLPFDTIHRYEEVDRYLVDLANAFPDVVTVVSAGRSVEGRDIKYLRISTTNFQDVSKPVVFLESLIHAREWVTLPTSLYAIEKLVIDVTERDLIDDIDWIILPIVNPDGYEWCHTNARFWRKNRASGLVAGDTCMGVDLNRNFDIEWGTESSIIVCSETFHGRGPFSEPETKIVDNIMREHKDRMAMFVDIHSYGSMILYGYGTGVLPPNGLQIHVAGVQMAQAIDAVKWPSNRDYIVGNSAHVLYGTSGSAQDYGQAVGLPITISYTFELPAYRNSGSLIGFMVDPDFIEQAGYETWEGLKTGARFALNQYRQMRKQHEH